MNGWNAYVAGLLSADLFLHGRAWWKRRKLIRSLREVMKRPEIIYPSYTPEWAGYPGDVPDGEVDKSLLHEKLGVPNFTDADIRPVVWGGYEPALVIEDEIADFHPGLTGPAPMVPDIEGRDL